MISSWLIQPCVSHTRMQFTHRLPIFGSRCLLTILFLCSSTPALAIPPPPNNPPNAPLQRLDPKQYDLTVSVVIPWNQAYPPDGGAKNPIRWPLLPRSNWSFVVDSQPIEVELHNGPQITKESNAWYLCKPAAPEGQWDLQIPISERCYGTLNFQIRMRMNTFSCQLDENAAARIGWPANWQGDSTGYMTPSDFIESDHDIFADAIADALHADPQSMPVHHVAKSLIRYCLQKIKSDGQYEERSRTNVRGLAVHGAVQTVKTGSGNACDLVCVCVATLRAAGIPARPVIGVTNTNIVGTHITEPRYIVWAEYALPTSGWVPFDPQRMQGTVNNTPLIDSWQGCGTMQFLNTRVPIAFSFVAGGVKDAFDAVGPWGWIPIYRGRPLPVPQDFVSIPWYKSAGEEVHVMVPYSPSIQNLGLVFVGTGSSTPSPAGQ